MHPGAQDYNSGVAYELAVMALETSHPYQDVGVKNGAALVAADEAGGTPSYVLDPTAIGVFGLDPETQLNAWRPDQASSNALSAEAAQYLFARYVADQFGAASIFPVEALTHDPAKPVRRLTVGPDGTGTMPLGAGKAVIIAVAGLAPDSTQRAVYQLRLVPR